MEEKKNRSDLLASDVLNVLEEPVFIVDESHRIVTANRALTRRLGTSLSSIVGKKCFECIHQSTSPVEQCPLKNGKDRSGTRHGAVVDPKHGEHQILTWSLLNRDGNCTEMLHRFESHHGPDESNAMVALRLSEEKYNKLFRSSYDAIFMHDLEGRIFDVNDRVSELFGYSRDELLNLTIKDLHPQESLALSKEAFGAIFETGYVCFEIYFIKKSGEVFPAEVSSSLFQLAGQTVVQGIARDLTERRRAEQERIELQRNIQHAKRLESLSVMAGGISHDINNMLMGVLGNAELIERQCALTPKARQRIENIKEIAKKAAELSCKMRDYTGRSIPEVALVDLGGTVRETAELLCSSLSCDIAIQYEFSDEDLFVQADERQIGQIAMNLVMNAAEAIGETAGTIVFRTSETHVEREELSQTYVDDELPPGRYICLECQDTGCGMDRDTLEKLFEPFFTTKFQGRGLGLAAVLGIVRSHKGAITATSEIGRGTTFRILFPAPPKNALRGSAKRSRSSVSPLSARGKILVIDDDTAVLDVTISFLEMMGFKVLSAVSGKMALKLFQEHGEKITLVLLDAAMPAMSGSSTFEKLRRINANIPILIMSGHGEDELYNQYASSTSVGFVSKPYAYTTLMKKIRKLITK